MSSGVRRPGRRRRGARGGAALAAVALVASCAGDELAQDHRSGPAGTAVVAAPTSPAASVAATPTPTPASVAATPTTATPRLVWSDEFDGPAGALPDPTRWRFEVGGSGWGNGQLEYDSETNAALDGGGHLQITAHPIDVTTAPACWYGACHFMSSRLTTAGLAAWTYGRFEMRAAFPAGDATWPAFWMLGADMPEDGWPAAGEIDIVEHIGRDGGTVRGTAHGPGYSAGGGLSGSTDVGDATAFHVYAVEWTADRIVWLVDGREYHRIEARDVQPWVFDDDFHLVLNLAIGGGLGGTPTARDFVTHALVVDHVRVYDLGG